MRAAIAGLLAVAVAGCTSGVGARVTIDRACAADADRIAISAVVDGKPERHVSVDAATFFAGDHTVVVIAPDGAHRVDVTATGFKGANEVANGHSSFDLPPHGIVGGVVSLNNCLGVDLGGTPPDLSMAGD